MDQLRAEVGITALAHAQQRQLASTGVLPWGHAQLCRELSAVEEFLCVPEAGDRGGRGEWADARHLLQTLARLAGTVPGLILRLDLIDLLLQHLEVFEQPLDKQTEGAGQLVLGVFDQRGHALISVGDV